MTVPFEEERTSLLRIVAELYAAGTISEVEMNERISTITAASRREELVAIAESMPADRPGDLALRSSLVESGTQRIQGNASVVKKKGDWLEARRLEVIGAGAAMRLDLRSYRDRAGLSLEVDFHVERSSVKVIVPKSFRVVDSIANSRSSVVKVKGRSDPSAPNTLVATGSVEASAVKFVVK